MRFVRKKATITGTLRLAKIKNHQLAIKPDSRPADQWNVRLPTGIANSVTGHNIVGTIKYNICLHHFHLQNLFV